MFASRLFARVLWHGSTEASILSATAARVACLTYGVSFHGGLEGASVMSVVLAEPLAKVPGRKTGVRRTSLNRARDVLGPSNVITALEGLGHYEVAPWELGLDIPEPTHVPASLGTLNRYAGNQYWLVQGCQVNVATLLEGVADKHRRLGLADVARKLRRSGVEAQLYDGWFFVRKNSENRFKDQPLRDQYEKLGDSDQGLLRTSYYLYTLVLEAIRSQSLMLTGHVRTLSIPTNVQDDGFRLVVSKSGNGIALRPVHDFGRTTGVALGHLLPREQQDTQ